MFGNSLGIIAVGMDTGMSGMSGMSIGIYTGDPVSVDTGIDHKNTNRHGTKIKEI